MKSDIKDEPKDLGFGTKLTDPAGRLINRDGSFNVVRVGQPFWKTVNLYHKLISISWPKFILIVIAGYIFINCFFAVIYLIIGVHYLKGVTGHTTHEQFWDAFFFSSQTITTVGYGHISPSGFLCSAVASFESIVGLLTFAIATGLLYGRFSRPIVHLLYSKHAIIAPYKEINAFEFRIANQQTSQLIEVEVQVVMTRIEQAEDGKRMRKYYQLALERNKINFLSLSWTIVHPIQDGSPLKGCTPQDLAETDTEFLILIKAFDDTFSQTVYDRSSYRFDEVVWGAKFNAMYTDQKGPLTILHLDAISSIERVELPQKVVSQVASAN